MPERISRLRLKLLRWRLGRRAAERLLSGRTTERLLCWRIAKRFLLVLPKRTSGGKGLLWLWTISTKSGACKVWLHGLRLWRLLLLWLHLWLPKRIRALHAAVKAIRRLLLLRECLLRRRKSSLLWRRESTLLLRKLLCVLSHWLLILLDAVEEVYQIRCWS